MEGTEAEALQDEILQKKAEARVGTTLRGKWKLDALIGVGGMGAVYEATHRNGMRGAVKLLHPERAADHNVKQRFMREGYIANKIDHVGAVRVLDDDDSDGTVFLVMELLEGHNIEMRALRSEGLMSAEETMIAMDQVLDTLVAAHEKGIIHRDLKPANIFITKNGIVKILDYGIARLTEAVPSSSATEMGIGMGTPAFMAPEQARGRWDEVDGRSDIWSVGATMFWMLSGTTVHDEGTGPEMLAATFLVQARPLRSVAKNVPRPLAVVVDRALMLDKKERWSSAREMQRALREAYEEIHGQPLPGPQPTHLSMPRISAPSFGSLERTSDVNMAKRVLLSTPAAQAPQETKDAKVTKSDPVVMVPQVDGSNRERVPPASLVPRPKKFSTPFIAALVGTVVVVAALALVFSSSKTEPKVATASAEVASASASASAAAPSFTAHEIATSNPTPREAPSVAPTVTSLKELVASSKKPKGAASNAPPVPKADGGAPQKPPPATAPTQKPDPETIF